MEESRWHQLITKDKIDTIKTNKQKTEQGSLSGYRLPRSIVIYGIDLQVSWGEMDGRLLRILLCVNDTKADISHYSSKLLSFIQFLDQSRLTD